MNAKEVLDAACALVETGTFALLAVKTVEGNVILRPIGGRWDAGIIDAIQEMADKYPGCKMRLFEQESNYEKYFQGIVPKEQVQPFSDLSPEEKVVLEDLEKKLSSPPWKEVGKEVDGKWECQVVYKTY